MAKGAELTGIKRKLFDWAVALGNEYDNQKSKGSWYNMQLAIANKLIFSKWREGLGNNVESHCYWWCCLPGKTNKNFYCCKNSYL